MKPKKIQFLSAYIVIEIGFRSYGIQSDCSSVNFKCSITQIRFFFQSVVIIQGFN